MIKSAPKTPEEDPAVRVLRERQVRELAELDEEENRRLKGVFRSGRGIRALRRSGESGNKTGETRGPSAGQRAFIRASGRGVFNF